jgi:pyruvate carboxylase
MKLLQLTLITLVFSITLVKAQNNVRMTSYYDKNDNKSYYLVWDIKTGKSMQYYWNGSEHKYNAFEINIPAQPLPGATGNIMFDVYYDYKDGKAYYIVWDTKTGKSIQYYWNGSAHKYDAFEINLPASPLPGSTGEVMIKVYYDSNDGKSYYIVYDTNGGKSIQYYWNGSEHKYNAFEINLPAQPLSGK